MLRFFCKSEDENDNEKLLEKRLYFVNDLIRAMENGRYGAEYIKFCVWSDLPVLFSRIYEYEPESRTRFCVFSRPTLN